VRCFVVGNGPCLEPADLDRIASEPVTFGINQCHLAYPLTAWRPTYWVCTDRDLNMEIIEWASLFYLHYSLGETCYIAPRHLTRLQSIGGLRQSNPYSQEDWWPQEWRLQTEPVDRLRILDMCSHHGTRIGHEEWWPKEWHLPQVCLFAGSGLTAIQLAVTMGYDEIYVLGMDAYYEPDKGNHFSEDYFNYRSYDAEWAEYLGKAQTYAHELAWRECLSRGIKIGNASRNSKLNAYPRVDLECVLGS